MQEPVTDALKRLVASSKSPEELNRRVIQSFGEGMLSNARQIAAETKGFEWLREGRAVQRHEHASASRMRAYGVGLVASRILHVPANLVLLVGSLVLVVVLLFPPYIVPLTQGLTTNAGYAFLFSPPQTGQLVAIVNVPLLAVEVAVILALVVAGVLIAHSVQGQRQSAGNNGA